MVKRKQTESQDNTTGADVSQPAAEIPLAQPIDEIEGPAAAPAATEQPKKEWAKRADPFGIHTVNWPDGYKATLLESDSNREIFIRFGDGGKDAMPQNFEAIKKMFKEEYKMYWDGKVQGWAKEIKPGVTPLIKQQNGVVRKAVEDAFFKAVELEEQSARGPSLSEQAKQRSAPGALSMTTRPFIALGSAPCNENPSKFGDLDYRANARRECQAYIQAIRNYLGPEPVGAELDTKVFDGDKGMYYEVVCYYDENNRRAASYARRCERQAPHTWEEGSIKPPTLARKRVNAR